MVNRTLVKIKPLLTPKNIKSVFHGFIFFFMLVSFSAIPKAVFSEGSVSLLQAYKSSSIQTLIFTVIIVTALVLVKKYKK